MKFEYKIETNWETVHELKKAFAHKKKLIIKTINTEKIGVDKFKIILDLELEY